MKFPQARALADIHLCTMPAPPPAPPVPVPVPIPLMGPGLPTVRVGGMPAVRAISDLANPANPHPIVLGSMTVKIGGLPASRIKDNCVCGGVIIAGQFTVLVGG